LGSLPLRGTAPEGHRTSRECRHTQSLAKLWVARWTPNLNSAQLSYLAQNLGHFDAQLFYLAFAQYLIPF